MPSGGHAQQRAQGCRVTQATASVTRTGFADTQIDLFCMATGNAIDTRRAAPNGGSARVLLKPSPSLSVT